jgi:hypothetical protein
VRYLGFWDWVQGVLAILVLWCVVMCLVHCLMRIAASVLRRVRRRWLRHHPPVAPAPGRGRVPRGSNEVAYRFGEIAMAYPELRDVERELKALYLVPDPQGSER